MGSGIAAKGPSINYVVLVGGGGSPKDDLLQTLINKKDGKGGGPKMTDFETT